MRKLVINEIVKNFEFGRDEIAPGWTRLHKRRPEASENPVLAEYAEFNHRYQEALREEVHKVVFDSYEEYRNALSELHKEYAKEFRKILNHLTNVDLLLCLDSQACQRYR